jgi:hypothetical protein
MNLNSPIGSTLVSRRRRTDSVALVITLLMLSLITFLAIAFLAMSRRNQSAVSASLDITTARAMSEAAQARAQAEIMAQIMVSGDALQYDYMVSRNAINPAGFNNAEKTTLDVNNVNYDYLANSTTRMTNSGSEQVAWVQNIANLYYDPRPPVFVVTNAAFPNNYDFRFYVDINRNGRFETNGYQTTFANEPLPGQLPILGPNAIMNGEPEFIGVLRNPLLHHSSVNPFIGRYAYLVLPIGKTLDLNYIHNFLKSTYGNVGNPNLNNTSVPGSENDGFARDQGIGSWELNLAGLLDAVSPWAYESNNSVYGTVYQQYPQNVYRYLPPSPSEYDMVRNIGNAFDDAEAILHYRYAPPSYYPGGLTSLFSDFPTNASEFENNYLDLYCANAPIEAPFDYNGTNFPISPAKNKNLRTQPWPGSYQTNMFFDVQDLFDPTKTSVNFINRMILASQRTNTFDRYTFQRLLSCIGMGSSPEYGVWVYANSVNIPVLTLRTKVNLNYDNTAQINSPYAPYAPMPTNLVPWLPVRFFTNAADLLLRSQGYVYINHFTSNGLNIYAIFTNYCGVTNIPIYSAANPGVHYDATVHRMLQLAANIYDATQAQTNSANALPPVRHPSVFRPLFGITNNGGFATNVTVYISGYAQVTSDAYAQMRLPFQDLTNGVTMANFHTNWNVAGIPWIVGANKGLPAFYQYACGSEVLLERKLKFPRPLGGNGQPLTNEPPAYTNQFYCMAVTNSIGMDAWNPYPTAFIGRVGPSLYYLYSNYVTIQITNGFNYSTNVNLTIANPNFPIPIPTSWAAGGGGVGSKGGFLTLLNSNLISLPESYYSPSLGRFMALTNGDNDQNSFLASDMTQKAWPVYNWTLNVSNHVVYALFDGVPGQVGTALLDFVNLGPFGSTISLTNVIANQNNNPLNFSGGGTTPGSYWAPGIATSLPNSPMSLGVLNQIATAYTNFTFQSNLFGRGTSQFVFDCPYKPIYVIQQPTNWVANDPLVHYTIEDLTWTGGITGGLQSIDANAGIVPPFTNTVGSVSARYQPWGLTAGTVPSTSMLFKDPNIAASVDWQFPTNKFPGVGWIGRVHRGTPWQTIFLKADSSQSYAAWSNWANPNWVTYPNAPETYPTNDWPLVDVFSTALNDNAACGLLAVNQTNDAAWAAVFAGVIALTNSEFGIQIMPNNNGVLGPQGNYANLVDVNSAYYGINAYRTNQPNGIFHKVGYILGASALTTTSPFLGGNASAVPDVTDEMVERIPQQTLSLLKVGEPQFVIFAWGQALKPKGPPFLGVGANTNTSPNYEITREFLTHTVFHLVYHNGLGSVVASYNVESGN